jgi:hypothetical protein
MPVVIGELEVMAAPPPAEPGPPGTPQPHPLTALDVVRVVDREHRRQTRRKAD